MELRDYVRVARRRWKLIALSVLTCVAAAAAVTASMTPQYQSTARLFVSTAQSDTADAYQGGLFSAQRVTSYADLVSSRDMAERVADRLDLDVAPQELADQVSARVVPETVILQLTATDPNPAQAQRLADAYAETLTRAVEELETPPGGGRAPIKASVVDAASFPETPVSPEPLRNVGLALVVGLLLGVGLAVVRELLDTSVKGPEDIESVTDAPLMGAINYDSGAGRRPLVTELEPHAGRVEAFRVLRTNLQFVDVDTADKVFVVTSSLPEEGKTTTAANLAITLAQAGHRTVLAECDLRRPRVADVLQMDNAVGITTLLLGRVSLADALQKHGGSGLEVLTSGAIPPNPAELLQSRAMAELITELRRDYDMVIIDAPPLLPVTDAALLTAQADGALVVVRHGRTTRDQLDHALDRIAGVDGRVLGTVLNMVPSRSGGKTEYGYGYGYGPTESPVERSGPGRRRRKAR